LLKVSIEVRSCDLPIHLVDPVFRADPVCPQLAFFDPTPDGAAVAIQLVGELRNCVIVSFLGKCHFIQYLDNQEISDSFQRLSVATYAMKS
jgi:hypothetical protein